MRKSWLVIRPQQLPVSFHLDQRVPTVLLVLGLVTLTLIVLNVGQGEYPIPPLEVLKTILGMPSTNPDYPFIINTLRLPRTLVAFAAGVGLALSGTILQGLTRNPLADPGIIGINAGAGLAAVSLIVLFPTVPLFLLPLSAFAGALTVAILIYLMAWDKGSSPLRLILMGVGFAAVLNALTTLIIAFGEINNVSQAFVWLAGSVYGRSWEHLGTILPWLGVFVPLSLILAMSLNALSLGDDMAKGLGARVEWQRGLLLLSSAAMAGASVAVAGTIGFVGLIAPHLGRQLVGPTHEGLLPTAALTGGVIVVLADWLGRVLFAPIELPCGVVTAAIGTPYFLYLLIRNRKR
ncbi:FecCD family ABC transporter permease [Allocoleopsis franciscana]|uniref:ABC-type Fe3+-siderophore transport system, permease component n=1 Tax=Allocoleopsis franciscana PCC 7113 TaxID=1173027 RepID=K9WDC8_9CYAN|nr:iron ABC transporter permease [Allocoleopsis franciscana]AFZ17527.1 ABC-type Fe3+-siderophore transport system, permease component [Allocoleopsis franciscana PCC 7113]